MRNPASQMKPFSLPFASAARTGVHSLTVRSNILSHALLSKLTRTGILSNLKDIIAAPGGRQLWARSGLIHLQIVPRCAFFGVTLPLRQLWADQRASTFASAR